MSRPAPRGSPLRRALDTIADAHPESAEEVIRRRLIALIALAEIPLTHVSGKIGMAHGLLARKLAAPDVAAKDRRPLDDETIGRILDAIDADPSRLVELDHVPGDAEVLLWLVGAVQTSRSEGLSRYLSAKIRLPVSEARELWTDADARIRRLHALGLLSIEDDQGTLLPPSDEVAHTGRLSATRSGWACAAR